MKKYLLVGAVFALALVGLVKVANNKVADYNIAVSSFTAPVTATTGPALKKSITVLHPDASQVVEITGEIGHNGLEIAAEIATKSTTSNKPIYLYLNSPGGSVLDGAMVLSAIEASRVPVYTVCSQLCASMAAIIFEYGTKRYMVDRSFVMFHPASGGASGELDKVVSRITSIQHYIGKMEAYIAKRTGLTFEEYKSKAGVEMWIDAEDAVNNGFADGLVAFIYTEQPKLSIFGVGQEASADKSHVVERPVIKWTSYPRF